MNASLPSHGEHNSLSRGAGDTAVLYRIGSVARRVDGSLVIEFGPQVSKDRGYHFDPRAGAGRFGFKAYAFAAKILDAALDRLFQIIEPRARRIAVKLGNSRYRNAYRRHQRRNHMGDGRLVGRNRELHVVSLDHSPPDNSAPIPSRNSPASISRRGWGRTE
jgi:hypothetical protein